MVKVWLPPYATETDPEGEMLPPEPALAVTATERAALVMEMSNEPPHP